MSENIKTNKFSEISITQASRDIIKIERDCFYGDQIESQRLEKIRTTLDLIFANSYSIGEDVN
jgi:hypothetical protein